MLRSYALMIAGNYRQKKSLTRYNMSRLCSAISKRMKNRKCLESSTVINSRLCARSKDFILMERLLCLLRLASIPPRHRQAFDKLSWAHREGGGWPRSWVTKRERRNRRWSPNGPHKRNRPLFSLPGLQRNPRNEARQPAGAEKVSLTPRVSQNKSRGRAGGCLHGVK